MRFTALRTKSTNFPRWRRTSANEFDANVCVNNKWAFDIQSFQGKETIQRGRSESAQSCYGRPRWWGKLRQICGNPWPAHAFPIVYANSAKDEAEGHKSRGSRRILLLG